MFGTPILQHKTETELCLCFHHLDSAESALEALYPTPVRTALGIIFTTPRTLTCPKDLDRVHLICSIKYETNASLPCPPDQAHLPLLHPAEV